MIPLLSELMSKGTLSLSLAMSRVIEYCELNQPDERWKVFRDLNYDQVDTMQHWLEHVQGENPPEEPLTGLYFGLFNPIYEDEVTADIYISGSYQEIEVFEDEDWLGDQDYFPQTGYAHSSILSQIYRLAYQENGLENEAEYPLCLAYGVLVVNHLLKQTDVTGLFHKNNKSIYVAVGYDDGDYVILGKITPNGLA